MSIFTTGGPKVSGINILSGAGSKYTDPLNLYPIPPPPKDMPQPLPAPGTLPWQGNGNAVDQGDARRAAAAAAGAPEADATGATKPTMSAPKQLTGT